METKKENTINVPNKKGLLQLGKILGLATMGLVTFSQVHAVEKKELPLYNIEANKDNKVHGTVRDQGGATLPGVSVVVKGTSIGTVTDMDGNFSISSSNQGDVLLFSFIGMKTIEVPINTETSLEIVLQENSIGLEEIVTIGYAKQKKSDITGAVKSITSEDFTIGSATNPSQLIKGKISGVNVTSSSGAPGSGQSIVIRGQGTIRQGAGPLFVIDGIPYGLAGTGGGTSPLNFINPEDIESMTVLKDASATAIYGSRGANGVILVSTKRGKKGTVSLSLSSMTGMANMAKKIDVFSADEFRLAVAETGASPTDREGNTDWQDELSQTGITQDYNLTMSGGTEKMTYRASLGYLDQEGILIHTGMERYTGRMSATQHLMDNVLSIDYNLSTTIEKSENANSSTIVENMLTFNPTYDAYDTNGDINAYSDFTNPLHDAELKTTFSESTTSSYSISPSVKLAKGLVYKMNVGYRKQVRISDYQEMPSFDPYVEGYLSHSDTRSTSTVFENFLTYDWSKNKHDLSAMAGYSFQKDQSQSTSWSISEFEANGIEPRYNPGLGQRLDESNQPSGSAQIDELQSYFGRATYNYAGKYMITGTVRMDGSSKFGANNRYGTFPSFAAGWRISEESFMDDSAFDNLKLRAGWGQTGNQEIPSKITQASYTSSNGGGYTYPLDESGVYPVGTVYSRYANPDIQWEVSTQTNIGVDFSFLNGALSGTADYFYKESSNILMEVNASDPVSTASTYWTNVEGMTITNQGVELALDYQNKTAGGITYNIGANISLLDNIVEGSPYSVLETGSTSGSGLTGATINGLINGESVGTFYMLNFTGIDDDGMSTYEGGSSNRQAVGSAVPDMLYSFYANLGYKGFDLSINFNGVNGNELYNNTAMNYFTKPKLATSNNTTAKALEYENESTNNGVLVSTRYLEDGSFLRLENLSLGYNMDTKKLGIHDFAKSIRFSVTGENLFVITDYTGYDPEVNQDQSIDGVQSSGIDNNAYPKSRTVLFGVNVKF